MKTFIVSLWKRLRGTAPGQPCPLGGKVLPVADMPRVIWGGTVEEPWPSSLSRGCPRCGEVVVDIKTVDPLTLMVPAPFMGDRLHGAARPSVWIARHKIPFRVAGRVRKFAKGEING